jgi:Na+-transporting NADH:ubiquinone oxidoreductase subunit NqrB
LRRLRIDPRIPQIAVLGGMLLYGVFVLDFVVPLAAIPLAIGTGLALEALLFRWRRARDRRRPPYESAVISSLSTLLLFRSNEPLAYVAVVAIAIASKVVLRVDGRHFVNPTNGAVLLGSVILPGWITSGQWGHDVVLAFALVAGSALILTRAGRLDTACAFLAGVGLCQLIRHYGIGYSWASAAHQLTNGALWLFAGYMITDPRTTPVWRPFRIAHGLLVAFTALGMAQLFWIRDSFLWSLLLCAPLVPIADWVSARLTRGGIDVPGNVSSGAAVAA